MMYDYLMKLIGTPIAIELRSGGTYAGILRSIDEVAYTVHIDDTNEHVWYMISLYAIDVVAVTTASPVLLETDVPDSESGQ